MPERHDQPSRPSAPQRAFRDPGIDAWSYNVGVERERDRVISEAARYFARISLPIWGQGDGHGGMISLILSEAFTEILEDRGESDDRIKITNTPTLKRLTQRDGWECHYCGQALGWGSPIVARPEIDHLVSKANGGSNCLENKVLACGPCNGSKGRKNHDDFCKRCEL